jgi:two-component system, NarL family, invasion response regulator UvrY
MRVNKIKVLIADDHVVVREGLAQLLSKTNDIVVACEAGNGQQVLEKVSSVELDIVLLDISMPGKPSLETLKEIKLNYPKLPVLVLSMYSEDRFAVRYLKAGASGYLTKESAGDQLVQAIRKVNEGFKFISPQLTEKLAFSVFDSDKPPHETLSDREFQVMCLLASGKTVSEIAKELFVSPNTISTHRVRILEKMKIKNNAQLTLYALQNGLVENI